MTTSWVRSAPAGIEKSPQVRSATGTAVARMYGRKVPHRVRVRSTKKPMSRSLTASHTRTAVRMIVSVAIAPFDSPSPS